MSGVIKKYFLCLSPKKVSNNNSNPNSIDSNSFLLPQPEIQGIILLFVNIFQS
jgi:hypothetical protein